MSDSPFQDVDDDSIEAEPAPAHAPKPTDGISRLFDGSAVGPSVEQLQADYNLPWHWATSLRGCCRVMTGDGVPPIFEIGLGTTLGAADQFGGSGVLDRDPGGNEGQEPESEQPRPWSE